MRTLAPNRAWRKPGTTAALCLLVLLAVALLTLDRPAEAAFPGVNGKIAFERFGDVYLANPGGADAKRITGDGIQANPAISPEGTRVAYEYRYGVWVMNADGTGQRQVSGGSPSTTFTDADPAWSPDGRKLVFSRYRGGDRDLWTVNLDGSGQVNVTKTPGYSETDPAWSPRGGEISYTRIGCEPPAGGISCVFKMDAGGGGQTNLTPEDRLPECPNQPGYLHRGFSSEPSWSPDGTKIAFRGTVKCPHTGGTDIWVMGADGGQKVNVTDDNGTGDNHPAFSPDGTAIAFNSSRPAGDPTAVYLVGAGGGSVVRLASSPGFDNDPDWGPRDTLAPAVTRVAPVNLARNVPPGTNVVAYFSEAMDRGTLNGTSFFLRKKGTTTRVAATVGYDAVGRRAILNPANNLRAGTTYLATVKGGGAGDLSGNRLPASKTWSFTVRR